VRMTGYFFFTPDTNIPHTTPEQSDHLSHSNGFCVQREGHLE
jgi:hypothetical protein